ncbi:heme-binding protein [Rhabdochromatium marinum]|uniref:heme-binding protein n=1 Tax=Rhabdochromatium marinum TaxID=48729 RepID=UPI001F5BB468|nr:heme-binding protein [Rhabdochromatium marinum]
MTAPVTQWSVRFIMPARYDLDSLPAPARDDVRLEQIPARRTAVVQGERVLIVKQPGS